jgi:hypothetical protein
MYEELRDMNNEIRKKTEKIAELRSALTSMGSTLGEKVQTSPTDRLSSIMCRIIILEEEVNSMIDEYASLKAMVTGEIFKLENEDWQDILCGHYVEMKPWRVVTKELSVKNGKEYTVKAVLRKKDRAIKQLKSIKKDTKSC